MRILVTGAGGQLGQVMAGSLAAGHDVVARTRPDLDIADWQAVSAAVTGIRPDAIVNCAAYNFVDQAEDEPVRALEINAWGPRNLARGAAQVDAVLVHFSTDFVFDGETSAPYTESDPPNPRGSYAVSKLLGEWLAAEAPRAYVLRVESLFGGARAKSSIDVLLQAVLGGKPAMPFADRVVSPSFVDDVVTATRRILEDRPATGLYHCVNTGSTTWLGLTRELARLAGRPDAEITPRRMSDASLRARRPLFAALSNAKLAAAGIPMPTWEDALTRYVRNRQSAIGNL